VPARRIAPALAVCGAIAAVGAIVLTGCAPDGPADVPASPDAAPAHAARTPSATGTTATTATGDANGEAADTAARAAAPTSTGGLVVTIGDSIMAGLGLDSDQAWPALLARDTGADIMNLSCSGAGFTIAGDCGDDYSGLVGQAIALQPDTVIVQSSDNDADASEDEIDEATHAAIDQLRAALPDAHLIGIGTLWHLDWDEPDAITWSSDALQSAVDADGGVFVSLGQPLRGRPELLQWDGEHPNAQGQIVLRDAVEAAFDDDGIVL